MTLLDHFHPPLSVRRHWHAFHNAWATYIAADLNRKLPADYFAEPNVQFGLEIDVATFEEPPHSLPQPSEPLHGDERGPWPIVAGAEWTPPLPAQTIPFQLITDRVEVTIYSSEAGPTLVGAIELVSPANKDRAAHRDAFVSKGETYLRQGVALIVVDVVTRRRANLHNELLARLRASEALPLAADLYAVAYRPVEHDGQSGLDIWPEPLAVGQALPTMPLWLAENLCMPVELGATYEHTCQSQRITAGDV